MMTRIAMLWCDLYYLQHPQMLKKIVYIENKYFLLNDDIINVLVTVIIWRDCQTGTEWPRLVVNSGANKIFKRLNKVQ